MPTKRTLTRQRDDARAARDRAIEQRDDAVKSAEAAVFNVGRLAGQVTDARNAQDAAEQKLTANRRPASDELRDTRRALLLCERARRSLAEQCATLQAANEAMCNERANGAPTWETAR